MNLILASGSPRRRELLSLYTSDFTVCVSDFDESAVTAPTPARLVEELARGKCLAVSAQHPGAVVIGCDPNTSLYFTNVHLPAVKYHIPKGHTVLDTEILDEAD